MNRVVHLRCRQLRREEGRDMPAVVEGLGEFWERWRWSEVVEGGVWVLVMEWPMEWVLVKEWLLVLVLGWILPWGNIPQQMKMSLVTILLHGRAQYLHLMLRLHILLPFERRC